jgi:hypothetical protein
VTPIAAAIVLAVVFAATRGLPQGAVMLLPFVAFALWSAASVVWSIEPDRSWAYFNRGLAYLAFALLGIFHARVLPYGSILNLAQTRAWRNWQTRQV